eukprot:Skav224292  [mRNA]  locus=scaffold2838:132001:132318:+ [translate_table: standard]
MEMAVLTLATRLAGESAWSINTKSSTQAASINCGVIKSSSCKSHGGIQRRGKVKCRSAFTNSARRSLRNRVIRNAYSRSAIASPGFVPEVVLVNVLLFPRSWNHV